MGQERKGRRPSVDRRQKSKPPVAAALRKILETGTPYLSPMEKLQAKLGVSYRTLKPLQEDFRRRGLIDYQRGSRIRTLLGPGRNPPEAAPVPAGTADAESHSPAVDRVVAHLLEGLGLGS